MSNLFLQLEILNKSNNFNNNLEDRVLKYKDRQKTKYKY